MIERGSNTSNRFARLDCVLLGMHLMCARSRVKDPDAGAVLTGLFATLGAVGILGIAESLTGTEMPRAVGAATIMGTAIVSTFYFAFRLNRLLPLAAQASTEERRRLSMHAFGFASVSVALCLFVSPFVALWYR